MTCPQVQTNLSLYLYGELEFSQEEALEEHLESCAFCQLALAREKEWHAAINADPQDVPFELLSECRRDLRSTLHAETGGERWSGFFRRFLPEALSATRWSVRLAGASFLVFLGFVGGRLMESGRLPALSSPGVARMGLFDPANAHVREIQPSGDNGVRIVLDRVQQQEITGDPEDEAVRQLLLNALHESADPGVRVYSVEILERQTSDDDVRDALLNTARTDGNAAVRIKSLEALKQFPSDPQILAAVESILKRDSNPAVRAEAIDILVPAGQGRPYVAPDVLKTLRELIESHQQGEYVRSRSLQALQAAGAPVY